eukprot:GEMP01019533.1.p1 GENE.GEMP01019533.1~~GEMP01019533.1.p1  ORF type:complete len:450 (+),score=89.51 GEMP01019533.1:3-1352(+)
MAGRPSAGRSAPDLHGWYPSGRGSPRSQGHLGRPVVAYQNHVPHRPPAAVHQSDQDAVAYQQFVKNNVFYDVPRRPEIFLRRQLFDRHVDSFIHVLGKFLYTLNGPPYRLSGLDLSHNNLADESLCKILEFVRRMDIRLDRGRLLLNGNRMTAKSIQKLEEVIWACPDPIQRLVLSHNRIGHEDVATILRTVYNHHSYPWRDENDNLWPLTLELTGNPGMQHLKGTVSEAEKQGGEDKVAFCFEPERPVDPSAYIHLVGPHISDARLFVHIPIEDRDEHLRPRRRPPPPPPVSRASPPRAVSNAGRERASEKREDAEKREGAQKRESPVRSRPAAELTTRKEAERNRDSSLRKDKSPEPLMTKKINLLPVAQTVERKRTKSRSRSKGRRSKGRREKGRKARNTSSKSRRSTSESRSRSRKKKKKKKKKKAAKSRGRGSRSRKRSRSRRR